MTNLVRICILTFLFLSPVALFAQSAVTQVSSAVTISDEISLQDLNQLIDRSRFRSVILQRPDHDRGNGLTVYQLRDVAEKARVSLIYQPIENGSNTQTDIYAFARYYNSLPKPILLICKSGKRALDLYTQAKQQGLLND
ncbi:beta-lactamase hydrolase domain-containing protein [Acinetobacter soli]|uniref:beta-lactamase hydrolase domain-containing protein n=1 Tax=Acinetobacter soli TaxID=487316 RepID=UPI00124FDE0E|nr:sulfur transferase domain-containing protein [Acinetobacter soli]